MNGPLAGSAFHGGMYRSLGDRRDERRSPLLYVLEDCKLNDADPPG